MSFEKLAVLIALLLLAACDSGTEPAKEYRAPVVVFAASEEATLEELFAGFTRETGIPVTLHPGESAALTEDVIANRGPQRADVLLTDNAADIWRAADEGALRPINAANRDNVAEFLRDPDGFWVAARMSVILIAVGPSADKEPPRSYADLGKPDYAGSLCLSTSSLPVNRALIAMLISDLGVKSAERVVRGWVRNLALPAFETEDALAEAVEAGRCAFAIVSSPRVSGGRLLPEPAYVDIEGIGVVRHAQNPESALMLVNWLLSEEVQLRHASATLAHPALANLAEAPVPDKISRKNVGIAGWQDTDAALLAERAGYR